VADIISYRVMMQEKVAYVELEKQKAVGIEGVILGGAGGEEKHKGSTPKTLLKEQFTKPSMKVLQPNFNGNAADTGADPFCEPVEAAIPLRLINTFMTMSLTNTPHGTPSLQPSVSANGTDSDRDSIPEQSITALVRKNEKLTTEKSADKDKNKQLSVSVPRQDSFLVLD